MTRAVGIDMGGTTARIVVGDVRKGAFEIHAAREVAARELAAELRDIGVKGAETFVGVTGRDMILRTTQVPPVPAWQLRELMSFEIDDIAEQSGDALSADYAMLGGAALHSDEDMVLLALVRSSRIEERSQALARAGVGALAFTPNAVALHNAFVAADGRDGITMVVSIGGANTDIALVEDGELLFARNLSGGGDGMTAAIASTLGIEPHKAENVKASLGVFATPGQSLDPETARVAGALDDSLRAIAGMLQSSIVLCRTQLQDRGIQPDTVMLCGAGAQVPGLDRALSVSLGIPVERFDPTEGYVVGDDVDALDHGGGAFGVATGLAMMGALKDAYRLEILTDAAKRAREFKTKTVWLVAAGLLVLAHLAVAFFVSQADHTAAEDDAAKLRRAAQSRARAASEHRRTAAAAREAAAKLAEIETVTSPGASVVTALDLLSQYLPSELWVTSLRTQRQGGANGVPLRTVVSLEGRGKEVSRPLTDAITELTQTLRRDPYVAEVTPKASTDPRGDFVWDMKLDLTNVPVDPALADDADDEVARAVDGQEVERGS